MTEALHRWSAVDLARALATRALSAMALADALVARSAALEPALHCWAWFDPDAARRQARAADRAAAAGPLHGLPVGVKDNIDTAGLPTRYGSRIYAGHVPAADAACVALARAAGAWVPGKTACTEFANTTPGPTRNPYDGTHTPGGSSSGSAAAVAAGLVPLALGTQTAGSVIRPAAFCGVVGYKPSPRRLPRAGVKPNSDTLDEVGVLARSVDDAALLARALSGSVGGALPSRLGLKPRVGMTLTSRASAAEPEMVQMVQSAAARLSAAGAAVHDSAWPASFDALFDAQRVVQLFETARALAPELQYRRTQLSPGLLALLDEGTGIAPAAYAAALQAGAAALAAIDSLFGAAQVLVTPGACGAAPRTLESTGDPMFNRPWQLLGCPCIVVPGGTGRAGLPLGLQVVGRPGDDDLVFAAAAFVAGVLQAEDITRARCLA